MMIRALVSFTLSAAAAVDGGGRTSRLEGVAVMRRDNMPHRCAWIARGVEVAVGYGMTVEEARADMEAERREREARVCPGCARLS